MTTKTFKTILFASLIVAMILPFSTMNYATAEEAHKTTKKIEIPKELNDKKYYLLDQAGEMLQNMTKNERIVFFAQMAESLKDRSPEMIQFDIEVEKLSYIILQDKTFGKYNIDKPSEEAEKQLAVIMNLPMVKLSEIMDKADAKIASDKAAAKKLGIEYDENQAYPAEMFGIDLYADEEDDGNYFPSDMESATTIPRSVELYHQVRISIPMMSVFGQPINVWVIDTDNSVTEFNHYLLVDESSTRINNNGGLFKFRSYVCLEDRGSMRNNVQFDMYASKFITNAFGSVKYQDVDYVDDAKLYFNQENYCVFLASDVEYTNPTSVLGDHAYHTSGLLNVKVK